MHTHTNTHFLAPGAAPTKPVHTVQWEVEIDNRQREVGFSKNLSQLKEGPTKKVMQLSKNVEECDAAKPSPSSHQRKTAIECKKKLSGGF